RRSIVVARALVAQGAINDDEIGRLAGWSNLPGRRKAQQEAATAGEKLFRHKNRKRRTNRAADNSHGRAFQRECIEVSVIARPWVERRSPPALSQSPDHVTVGIENADRRDVSGHETLLPSRFTQQRRRQKDRWRRSVLAVEDGRLCHGPGRLGDRAIMTRRHLDKLSK